jgi:glycosyltransferase involved in cell wall biosynthesis
MMSEQDPALPSVDVCVLMPVYAGTPAAHLALALESIARQTVAPDSVLLIQDGDLHDDHQTVIDVASRRMQALRVLRPGRVGLVAALNAGLAATWVARMDADDVAEPCRLERQLRAAALAGVDVIGSAMTEFEGDPDVLGAVRDVPRSHDDIVAALPRLNPVNHPTVMFRRSTVLDVGGYQPIAGMEDYLLWARLVAAGVRFHNLPDSLVRYRVDHQSYQRRADPRTIRAEWTLQQHLRGLGLVGPVRSVTHLLVRVGFRLLPPFAMRPAYAVVRAVLTRRSSAAR